MLVVRMVYLSRAAAKAILAYVAEELIDGCTNGMGARLLEKNGFYEIEDLVSFPINKVNDKCYYRTKSGLVVPIPKGYGSRIQCFIEYYWNLWRQQTTSLTEEEWLSLDPKDYSNFCYQSTYRVLSTFSCIEPRQQVLFELSLNEFKLKKIPVKVEVEELVVVPVDVVQEDEELIDIQADDMYVDGEFKDEKVENVKFEATIYVPKEVISEQVIKYDGKRSVMHMPVMIMLRKSVRFKSKNIITIYVWIQFLFSLFFSKLGYGKWGDNVITDFMHWHKSKYKWKMHSMHTLM